MCSYERKTSSTNDPLPDDSFDNQVEIFFSSKQCPPAAHCYLCTNHYRYNNSPTSIAAWVITFLQQSVKSHKTFGRSPHQRTWVEFLFRLFNQHPAAAVATGRYRTLRADRKFTIFAPFPFDGAEPGGRISLETGSITPAFNISKQQQKQLGTAASHRWKMKHVCCGHLPEKEWKTFVTQDGAQ